MTMRWNAWPIAGSSVRPLPEATRIGGSETQLSLTPQDSVSIAPKAGRSV
jgi:hypothetical protein